MLQPYIFIHYAVSAFCHTTKHYCQTHVWYTLNKACLFSFQKHLLGSWIGSELQSVVKCMNVQRLVRVVSYLHLSPGKGFYMRKCVYNRFMIGIPKILLHITKRCCSQKNNQEREKKGNVICSSEDFTW
jgi:hypothetical protein